MRSKVVSRAKQMFAQSSVDHRRRRHGAQGACCALDVESSFVTALKCLPPPLAMKAGASHRRDAPNKEKNRIGYTLLRGLVSGIRME